MTAATAVRAVRAITVHVTQDHIDRGTPCDCGRCPIALAILGALPAADVEVCWNLTGHAYATAWLARGTITGWLGETADRFIRDFDCGEPVGPFEFTITIPEEAA